MKKSFHLITELLQALVLCLLVFGTLPSKAQDIPVYIPTYKSVTVAGASDSFLNGFYAQEYTGRWTNGIGGNIWWNGGTFWYIGADDGSKYWDAPQDIGAVTNAPNTGTYPVQENGVGSAPTVTAGTNAANESVLINTNLPAPIAVGITDSPVLQVFTYNDTTNAASVTQRLQVNCYTNYTTMLYDSTDLTTGAWTCEGPVTNGQIIIANTVSNSLAADFYRLQVVTNYFYVTFLAAPNGSNSVSAYVLPDWQLKRGGWYGIPVVTNGQTINIWSNTVIVEAFDSQVTNLTADWPAAIVWQVWFDATNGMHTITNTINIKAGNMVAEFEVGYALTPSAIASHAQAPATGSLSPMLPGAGNNFPSLPVSTSNSPTGPPPLWANGPVYGPTAPGPGQWYSPPGNQDPLPGLPPTPSVPITTTPPASPLNPAPPGNSFPGVPPSNAGGPPPTLYHGNEPTAGPFPP